MSKVWTWLKDPLNLAVIVTLASGLGFVWRYVVQPQLKYNEASTVTQSQTATADHGTAINARDNAQVGKADHPASNEGKSSSAPLLQEAKALNQGRAINASGSSRVTIDQDQNDTSHH